VHCYCYYIANYFVPWLLAMTSLLKCFTIFVVVLCNLCHFFLLFFFVLFIGFLKILFIFLFISFLFSCFFIIFGGTFINFSYVSTSSGINLVWFTNGSNIFVIVHEMMSCSLVLLSMNFQNCLLLNVIVTCLTIFLIPTSLNLEKLCIPTSPYSSLDAIVHFLAIVVMSFTLDFIMCPIVNASCGQYYCNPNLKLMIKVRAYEGAS